MERFHSLAKARPVTEYQGTAPSVFIGSARYPSVSGGPLLVQDTDIPTDWLSQGLGIEDIVSLRSETIRGISKVAPYLGRYRISRLLHTRFRSKPPSNNRSGSNLILTG